MSNAKPPQPAYRSFLRHWRGINGPDATALMTRVSSTLRRPFRRRTARFIANVYLRIMDFEANAAGMQNVDDAIAAECRRSVPKQPDIICARSSREIYCHASNNVGTRPHVKAVIAMSDAARQPIPKGAPGIVSYARMPCLVLFPPGSPSSPCHHLTFDMMLIEALDMLMTAHS